MSYSVVHEALPLLITGNDLYITIDFRQAATPEAIERYDHCIFQFWSFCDTGAFGSDMVEPWTCHSEDCSIQHQDPLNCTWRLSKWKSDERAMVVLAQWLLDMQDDAEMSRLCFGPTVTTGGMLDPIDYDPQITDPFPSQWPKLPFRFDYDEYFYEDACVYIEWSQKPSLEQKEEIDTVLSHWAWVTADGFYPIAPMLPKECSMLFDDDHVEWVDSSMEFPFTKFRAHPAAIDGLVNICAALHHKTLAISEITIE